MSDSDSSNASQSTQKGSILSSLTEESNGSRTSTESHDELIAKAKTFLRTPSVVSQGISEKREFLLGKGLNEGEVEKLLMEVPPPIPPRTYPRPAPSKLPIILYAITRILVLLSGASVVSAAMYFTYIYPKLAASFGARAKLSAHQTSLVKRLKTSAEETKAKRMELLPPQYADNTSVPMPLDGTSTGDWDIVEKAEIPEVEHTSADTGMGAKVEEVVTDADEQGQAQEQAAAPSDLQNQSQLLDQAKVQEIQPPVLTITPLFKAEGDELIQSLQKLKAALPRRKAAYGSTLVDLTRMTDLISKKSVPKLNSHSPQELEVRKEIAAAKGLLLNRRSFMNPSSPVTTR